MAPASVSVADRARAARLCVPATNKDNATRAVLQASNVVPHLECHAWLARNFRCGGSPRTLVLAAALLRPSARSACSALPFQDRWHPCGLPCHLLSSPIHVGATWLWSPIAPEDRHHSGVVANCPTPQNTCHCTSCGEKNHHRQLQTEQGNGSETRRKRRMRNGWASKRECTQPDHPGTEEGIERNPAFAATLPCSGSDLRTFWVATNCHTCSSVVHAICVGWAPRRHPPTQGLPHSRPTTSQRLPADQSHHLTTLRRQSAQLGQGRDAGTLPQAQPSTEKGRITVLDTLRSEPPPPLLPPEVYDN